MDLFRNPWMLLWIPACLGAALMLRLRSSRRRAGLLAALGLPQTLERLYPPQAAQRRKIRFQLLITTLALMLFALAGPQWGIELVASTARGLNVIAAVDTSLSMLTEDMSPNRIAKAKAELAQILNGLRGERVGVVAFSGRAHIQCPLTADLDAAKSFLDSVKVGMVPQPGTALASALELGARMLSPYSGHKAMVLLTDGEDHMGRTLEAAKEAARAGIQVYIVGVGTPEGGPIPLRDDQGRFTAYKKDKKGGTVISRLGEDGLIRIAKASSGAYYRATAEGSEAAAIVKNISAIESSKIRSGSRSRYRDRYRWPLALALLLLFLEMLIPETGGLPAGPFAEAAVRLASPARRSPAITAALLLASLHSGCGREKAAADLWRGNRDYNGGRFDRALDRYLTAMRKTPKDPRPVFNAGDAQYKMGQWEEALERFSEIADPKRSPKNLLPKALYNRGDTNYQKGECPKALEDFKNCLLLDPKDEDCRFNLVKALECLKNSQKQKQPQNRPKDQKKENNPQKPPASDRPRPQPEMSREDAERILQAVREREKGLKARRDESRPNPAQAGNPEEDW